MVKVPLSNSFLERRDARRKFSESLGAGASLAPRTRQRILLGSENDRLRSCQSWKASSFSLGVAVPTSINKHRMRYVGLGRDNLRSHFVFRPRHVPLEEVIAGTEDVNAAWSACESRFLDIIRHYIPCHTITVRRKNKVWMNSTLHKLSRKKHRLFKRFQRTKRQADWQKYKDFKNFCNAEFTRHKKQYFRHLHNSIREEDFGSHRWWTKAKRMARITSPSAPIPDLSYNDQMASTDIDKANVLALHFAQQCSFVLVLPAWQDCVWCVDVVMGQ